MKDTHLDQVYTALAEATTRVGESKAPLFLATLSMSLIAVHEESADVLRLIAQAERLSAN